MSGAIRSSTTTPIPPALEGLARRAVSACPTLALRLQASLMQSGASVRDGGRRGGAAARRADHPGVTARPASLTAAAVAPDPSVR